MGKRTSQEDGSASRPLTRRELVERRIERSFAAWMVSLSTIMCWRLFGPWTAWGYMVGWAVICSLTGIYWLGVRDGEAG